MGLRDHDRAAGQRGVGHRHGEHDVVRHLHWPGTVQMIMDPNRPINELVEIINDAVFADMQARDRIDNPLSCDGMQWWAQNCAEDCTIVQYFEMACPAIESGEGNSGWAYTLMRFVPHLLQPDIRLRLVELLNADQAILVVTRSASPLMPGELAVLRERCVARL